MTMYFQLVVESTPGKRTQTSLKARVRLRAVGSRCVLWGVAACCGESLRAGGSRLMKATIAFEKL